jgi:hypothetical protein
MSKNPEKPKTGKAPAAKRAAFKTGAKAAAAGIRDPVFAMIDAHKARVRAWSWLGARPWFPGVPTRSESDVTPGQRHTQFEDL